MYRMNPTKHYKKWNQIARKKASDPMRCGKKFFDEVKEVPEFEHNKEILFVLDLNPV